MADGLFFSAPSQRARQGELAWFSLYPPATVTLHALTAFIRPLANQPRSSLIRRVPPVVFELWSHSGSLHWLVGMDTRLAQHLPRQLAAQLPKLHMIADYKPVRPAPLLASNVRLTGLSQLLRLDMAAAVSDGLLAVLKSLGTEEVAVVQWELGPAQSRKAPPRKQGWVQWLGGSNAPELTATEERSWRLKASEPLLAVRGHIGAQAAKPSRSVSIVRLLGNALALANASHAEVRLSHATRRVARRLTRPPARFGQWSGTVNAAEIALLLGWPVGTGHPSLTVSAPAPRAVLLSKECPERETARILGESRHPRDRGRLVFVPVPTALHHVHVIGPTGSGKSDLLAGFARADAASGASVLVIEPKGDLIYKVLAGLPNARHRDVVVVEPGNHPQVVGINPLAGPRQDAERRADQLLEVFDTLHGGSIGPRSRDVLLHTLIALARSKDGTLADVPVLLTNQAFRRRLLADVTDPLVLAPFFAWYDGLADTQRSTVTAPVLNKTRAFLSRSAVRRFLGQPQPGFQLDDLCAHRRVMLVNLNRGLLGDQAATLIGTLLLMQLWPVIQRRAVLSPTKRHPLMVIVDEVQNYLRHAAAVREMLEQARGLGASLTLAHQSLNQLAPPVRSAVLANARSRVAFRPGPQDAAALASSFGLDADILNRLGAFEACTQLLVDGSSSEPFAIKTLPVGEGNADVAALRERSRQAYGVDAQALDTALTDRWYGHDQTPEAPIGTLLRRTP